MWRHTIHENPEIAHKEVNTARLVAEKLKAWGYSVTEGVGGTAEHFVQLMNDQAKVLGMKSTSYKNPEGLTEAGHTTTARDLSVLAVHLMTDFPDYIGYSAAETLSLVRSVYDSPFVLGLQESARTHGIAVNVGVHEPTADGKKSQKYQSLD